MHLLQSHGWPAFIAIAIILMRIAAAVALLAHIAGLVAIITYSICIAVLDRIGHAATLAVLKHACLFATLVAVAISVMLISTLLRIFASLRSLLDLAAIIGYIIR